MWVRFERPLAQEPTDQNGVTWVPKSVFVFFTPSGEALYAPAQRELWRCSFAVRRLISSPSNPAEEACKVAVHLLGCFLPLMVSSALTGVTRSRVTRGRCALQALLLRRHRVQPCSGPPRVPLEPRRRHEDSLGRANRQPTPGGVCVRGRALWVLGAQRPHHDDPGP